MTSEREGDGGRVDDDLQFFFMIHSYNAINYALFLFKILIRNFYEKKKKTKRMNDGWILM